MPCLPKNSNSREGDREVSVQGAGGAQRKGPHLLSCGRGKARDNAWNFLNEVIMWLYIGHGDISRT